jgi:hypothetical protein
MDLIRFKPAWITLVAAGLSAILMTGCGASRGYRFSDAEPVMIEDDARPVPVPKTEKFKPEAYEYNALFRRPIIDFLDIQKIPPAGDVNAMDDVPASTWFTPRLGYHEVTPEALVRGPGCAGPPRTPVKVLGKRTDADLPGLLIEDARGERYLMTLDPPGHPGLATASAFMVNRLFWGFGYHVPEEHLFFFSPGDLLIDPSSGLTREDLSGHLEKAAAPEDGCYRAIASLYPGGVHLGPFTDAGIRKDDPNDRIPHENRRSLRGLRSFSSFTNYAFIRMKNTLDVYEGEPDQGHVRHYLINFSGALGNGTVKFGYTWGGYSHVFSYGDIFRNLGSFGLAVRSWEKLRETPWPSVGTFESEHFEADAWREVLPYLPIRRCRPADDYWAAKVLGALTRAHVRALAAAARYPEPGAADYIVDALMARRDKVLAHAFERVSPLEAADLQDSLLVLKDMESALLDRHDPAVRYEIRCFDGRGEPLSDRLTVRGESGIIHVPLPPELKIHSKGYLRVEVCKKRGARKAPPAARFHFRGQDPSSFRLVGVVH